MKEEKRENNFNLCPYCDGICVSICITKPVVLSKEEKRKLSAKRKALFREVK